MRDATCTSRFAGRPAAGDRPSDHRRLARRGGRCRRRRVAHLDDARPAAACLPDHGDPASRAGREHRIVGSLWPAGVGARDRRLRRSPPGNTGPVVTVLPENTPLVVTGTDRTVDGIVWRQVRAPGGADGWIAASFVSSP
jgi:hypothetical protein